jgi:glutaredoxin
VISSHRVAPVYPTLLPLLPLLTLAQLLSSACTKEDGAKAKLRCSVAIPDANAPATMESVRSPARPSGWLRATTTKGADAQNPRLGRMRGEVLYLDAEGHLVKARSKDQVPPEFRGAMVARSGGLGAPGSYSVIDFGKLPDPPKKTTPAARPAQTAGEKRPVKVFGTSWCQACQMTKSYLAGKDVSFAMRDIEGDSAALAEYMSYGGNEVPLVVIGETVIRGFVPSEIDRALGL